MSTSYLKIFISVLSFFSLTTLISQEKLVRLIEDQQAKRTIIYVQNDTDTDKSVFLKINPKGYRKSAQRPIIKKIPAKSKEQMLILIPLTDVISSYTYDLITNDKSENLNIKRKKLPKKESSPDSIMKIENLIFTKKQCKKCELLISKLKKKHIKYKEINIDTKNQYNTYLWKLLDKNNYNKDTVTVPLCIIKEKLVYPIDNIDMFIEKL